MDMVTELAKLVDGCYSLCLPLKKQKVNMPNNCQAAEQQALNLQRKFNRNPNFHQQYSTFMTNLNDKGYAVQVPEDEHKRSDGKVWYIPYHGVYHPVNQKFYCALYQGTSLNEQLLQGHDLTSSLVGIII